MSARQWRTPTLTELRQWQSARDELIAFTEWLTSVAIAASSPDERSSEKLTHEERQEQRRQADKLATAVEGLKKIIADKPYEHDREHGFYQLWSALGAAVIIGRHCMIDPPAERIKCYPRQSVKTENIAGHRRCGCEDGRRGSEATSEMEE